MDLLKTELLNSISRIICSKYPQTGIYNTNLPNLYISRFNAQRTIYRHFIHPTFIVFLIYGDEVKVELGSEQFSVQKGVSLVNNIFAPISISLPPCSAENPILTVNVPLYRPYISEVLIHLNTPKNYASVINSIHSAETAAKELSDLLSILQLIDSKGDVAYGYELALKELYYNLLLGEHGDFIRGIFAGSLRNSRILEVINYLSKHYKENPHIKELADKAFMSPSNFYKIFGEITSLSPLQYVKRLRLYEGRRLILTEKYTVSHAAHTVGYLSRTQFSIDYTKIFHHNPQEDCNPSAQK